jgi:hypothetical protein
MTTKRQFIGLLAIAALALIVGVSAIEITTVGTHEAQATAYDCTQPNPPPNCYNS